MEEQAIHIVDRPLTPGEAEALAELKQAVYFSDDRYLPKGLDFKIRDLSLDERDKHRINYALMEKCIAAGESEVQGQSLNTLFSEAHFNLWFYSKFRIYFLLRNLFYLTELISKITEEYKRITYYTLLGEEVLRPFLPDHVEIRTGGGIQRPYSTGEKLRIAAKLAKRSLFSGSSMRSFRKAEHILLDTTLTGRILDLETLKVKKGNYILDYLFGSVPGNFRVLKNAGFPSKGVDIEGFYREADSAKNTRIKYLNAESIYRGLPFLFLHYRGVRKSFARINDQVERAFRQETDPFIRLYLYLIGSLRTTHWMLYLQYVLYKRLFRKSAAKTITGINENSPDVKVITDAAKTFGIRVIGVQHGAIHRLHPAYMHSRKETEAGLLPDVTLVWGEYWRQILIRDGGYEASSVVVTGHPRTDAIPAIRQLPVPDHGPFTLLFASQPQRDPILRKKTAMDIFTAAAYTGIELVLRPHPGEFDFESYYPSLAMKAGLSGLKIEREQDLYLAIHSASAVITSFSTVGAETLFFDKPLIVYDPLEQDIQGYIAKGVGTRVTGAGELEKLLTAMQSGIVETNVKAGEAYVRENAYLIDGNVNRRVLNAILATGAQTDPR
ncbi:MAG: hypothetical protein ACOYXB_05370 [Bacteroidota bacterium]